MASGICGLILGVRDLFYPPKCSACKQLLPWYVPTTRERRERALCAECYRLFREETGETCGVCGERVRHCFCMPLLLYEAKCRGFCKLAYYVPSKTDLVQNRLVYHIKRSNDSKTFRFLAKQLSFGVAKLLEGEKAPKDVLLTYVPRSRTAILREGVDQSRALAECLGKYLGIECKALIVRDAKSNTPQKELTPEEREKNAQAAFSAISKERICRGKTVLLVDDVVTTGATAARCVRLLRRMGAAHVYCVAAASDGINRYRGVSEK